MPRETLSEDGTDTLGGWSEVNLKSNYFLSSSGACYISSVLGIPTIHCRYRLTQDKEEKLLKTL